MLRRILFLGLLAPIVAAASTVQSAPAPGAPPPPPVPLAPAIEAGDPVFDRTGQQVGQVQGLVEAPAGAMVVARIDGKLISLPQSTLQLDKGRLVSSQSKAQMIAAAGAPR